MKHVSIYLSNANLTPSSYYRLTQYFAGTGARLHSSLPDSIYTWWHRQGKNGKRMLKPFLYFFYVFRTLAFLLRDVFAVKNGTVIISRVIVPHHTPWLHKYLVKRLAKRNQLIWDFDDNIIANKSISPSDFLFFSQHSHKIVVTNEFLKSLIDKRFADKVTMLPTTDGDLLAFETTQLTKEREQLYTEEIRMVWVATYSGLDYLRPLIPTLDEAAKALKEQYGKKLSLHVVCNKPLTVHTSCLELVNILWKREVAKQEIVRAHVGIMPLPDTEFTRGKGGFKLVQYMSASLPVIASNVGFNQQVVTNDTGYLIDDSMNAAGWKDAILELGSNWERYRLLSQHAKNHYNTSFSFDHNKRFWEQATKQQKQLLMIVNEDRFFLSHRKDIALVAQRDGWDVTIVCKDTGRKQEVEALGLKTVELPINPTGTNLRQELRTCFFLRKLYSHNKDAVVHHVGMKLILWGGLAAKMAKTRGVVNAISGLGVMFSDEKLSLTARGILHIMRYSHHRKGVLDIFQNKEDEQLFLQYHIIQTQQSVLIKGSGIDLSLFSYHPQPDDNVVRVLFTGRMVAEKGVIELIKAAELLRTEYEGRLEFLLCGTLSTNPKAIRKDELEALCDGRYIKWLGYRDDVRKLLIDSHIMAFPSYYREGVPKSLIEACAIGRPIVTTNSIGCKDTVEDGVNGFLVPVKDSHALADKLKLLIDDKALRETMGKAARKRAEQEFAIETVVQKHLDVYEQLTV